MIDGARNGTLQHVVSSTDPNYMFSNTGLPSPVVTITVTDNDVPGRVAYNQSSPSFKLST